ncbi:MAG: FecR domain-containing protein [Elusimicrobiota bacterium]|nr:FecR domain-containing protein [Elusimicrobiota bacterium]
MTVSGWRLAVRGWACFFLLLYTLHFTLYTAVYSQDFSGELGEIKGTVEILKDGETEWVPAVSEMPVQLKDRLKAAENSSCNLELDDGSVIFIGENTEASVEMLELTAESHNSKISLWFGKIIANISKSKNTKMEVHSPTAIVAVRGTEFAVETNAEKTDVGVFDGEVGVKNTEGAEISEVTVKPNEETSVQKGTRPRPPSRLILMQKYKERNLHIKNRVAMLRERLKRLPPEKRVKARQIAYEKFQKLREKRIQQMKKNQQKRKVIKREIIKRKMHERNRPQRP